MPYNKLAVSLAAGRKIPPLPAQAHHDAAKHGANTGAREALPIVPGHTLGKDDGTQTPIQIQGAPKRRR
jgi:hypothetical protein